MDLIEYRLNISDTHYPVTHVMEIMEIPERSPLDGIIEEDGEENDVMPKGYSGTNTNSHRLKSMLI